MGNGPSRRATLSLTVCEGTIRARKEEESQSDIKKRAGSKT